jgi:hypothetical protein
MENEFMRRGYLLPDGCKDLIDALHINVQQQPTLTPFKPTASIPPPALVGTITVSETMTPVELAQLLHQKPFRIIADCMEFGCYVTTSGQMTFDLISKVARKYGLLAKKAE